MWVCPKCGEPHEDHFKICWKCASQEMTEHVTAETPARAAVPEPRLRSGGSIMVRIVIGFVVGAILGGAVLSRFAHSYFPPEYDTASATSVATVALISGVGLAIVIGVFFWVIFPYEPTPAAEPAERTDAKEDSPS